MLPWRRVLDFGRTRFSPTRALVLEDTRGKLLSRCVREIKGSEFFTTSLLVLPRKRRGCDQADRILNR